MAEIKITQFVPEQNEKDFSLLLPAFLKIWNHPENHKQLSVTQHPLEDDTIHSWLRHHVRKGISYYCAIDDHEQIVGISVIREHATHGLLCLGLAVRPENKHQGIGSLFIEDLISVVAKRGYSSVEVPVFADNIRMLRLLLKFGFIPARMEYHKRYDGVDLVYMKYMHA